MKSNPGTSVILRSGHEVAFIHGWVFLEEVFLPYVLMSTSEAGQRNVLTVVHTTLCDAGLVTLGYGLFNLQDATIHP